MSRLVFILFAMLLMVSCNKNDSELIRLLNIIIAQNDSLKNQVLLLQKKTDSVSVAMKLSSTGIALLEKRIDSVRLELGQVLLQVNELKLGMQSIGTNMADVQVKLFALQKKVDELYLLLMGLINASTPAATIKNELLVYYPFAGSPNDSSGNGFHGNVVGARLVSDRFGKPGNAYFFDYYQEITSGFNKISGSQSRSISFWMRNRNANKTITPIWYGGTSVNPYPGDAFDIRMNRNEQHDPCGCWPVTYEGAGIASDWVNVIYKINIGDDVWHHYVYVFESAGVNFGQVRIYQDGSLVSTSTNKVFDYNGNSSVTVNTLNTKALVMGRSMADINFPNSLLDRAPTEYLDDIRIYGRVLTEQEIRYLFALPY